MDFSLYSRVACAAGGKSGRRFYKRKLLVNAVVILSSSCHLSNGLVTGKLQVHGNLPTSWGHHSDSHDTIANAPAWNSTMRLKSFENSEEKSKREMEWIVRNTEKILGPDSPAAGSMSPLLMKVTSNLMSAWTRRALKPEGSKAPHVVERLLQRLIKEQDAGNQNAVVGTFLYNKVLEAWSNSNEEGSAERSEEILMRMEQMYLEDGNETVKPDESSYNAVIKAYVKNGNRQITASKVESLIQRMEQYRDTIGVSPNKRSYNLLLYAFANSNLQNSAQHAEDTLLKMRERYKEGDVDCKPDVNSYNQVLTAWARGKCVGFEYRMDAVYQELLNFPEEMDIQPNTDSFNTVMGGWLKSEDPSSWETIQGVLETMEHAYETGNPNVKPDRVTINTLTAAHLKDGKVEESLKQATMLERKYNVMPNTISHNIIVDSWCKSGRADSPRRALDLLTAMEKAFIAGKNNMKPDGYTYSSVIACFNRFNRKDSTKVAEDLLVRMKNLYANHGGDPPTTSVYNAVINVWSSHPDSKLGLGRVRDLLKEMEENHARDPGIPKANRITYNTVIKAMRDGTQKSADFAEEILATMEKRGTSDSYLLPNSYTYTSTITAIGRSNCSNKAQRAFAVLLRMLLAMEKGNLSATPTLHSYNAVLNACAFSRGDEKARSQSFDIAMKTYEMLKERGTPDHTTYGTLLRICATLVPASDPKREELVNEIFQEARETGNVGRLVLTQLKFASTRSQHVLLTGRAFTERINVKDFPTSWSRNVREAEKTGGRK
jgi:hypothetical protein